VRTDFEFIKLVLGTSAYEKMVKAGIKLYFEKQPAWECNPDSALQYGKYYGKYEWDKSNSSCTQSERIAKSSTKLASLDDHATAIRTCYNDVIQDILTLPQTSWYSSGLFALVGSRGISRGSEQAKVQGRDPLVHARGQG
jgi:hypothetical protein